MRIAIDIDSTLHHYWDAARRRAPSAASASTCPTTTSTPGRSAACATSSCARRRATRTPTRPSPAREPYPRRGRDRQRAGTRPGHLIHITSHRARALPPGHRGAGWTPSACTTTSSTAPTTRSAAAWSSASTSSSTTAPSTSRARRARHGRGDDRPPVEPGAVRGGGRRASAPTTGRASPPRSSRCWRGLRRARMTPARIRSRAARRPSDRRTSLAPAGEAAAGHRPARRYLPGVEPERQLNDWGRSERIEGLFDRTLVDFLYRCGSAARSRGSRTCRPTAARCWSPTTPARCRPTRR